MDVKEAQALAEEAMREHGLTYDPAKREFISRPWSFAWIEAKRVFGRCSYQRHEIILSRPLVALNSVAEVRNVILHEIAHALVGPEHGHDRTWKLKCVEVGARPERCYSTAEVVMPPMKWIGQCGDGCAIPRERLARSTRTVGCRKHSERLVWTRNTSEGVM